MLFGAGGRYGSDKIWYSMDLMAKRQPFLTDKGKKVLFSVAPSVSIS